MIKLKSIEEIGKIRESCQMLSETYRALIPMVSPGISTGELDRFANSYIRKLGGKPAFLGYMGYPAALCTSVNEEIIHGIPGKRILKEGDIVSLDLGINLDGYFSDRAVTVPVGTVSQELTRLLKVTEECLFLAIEQAVCHNRIKDISQAVFGHAKQHGYGVVREYCGHGVGFAPHEDPQVPNYVGRGPNPRLKAGMVIAIEPMINMGGDEIETLSDEWTVITADFKPSAHFEHTVAVFEDHTEILTL
ncbi:MAG: type I methionyl aminopeptidase [Spirochaetales bacterium]|nr:type I methionyl aminopeptidase [Spirochaetales bacterium]